MAARKQQSNPNQSPAQTNDETPAQESSESSEANTDQGSDTQTGNDGTKDRAARTNPNTPLTQLEQRKALEDAANATSQVSLRDSLTDDPEALKDQVVALTERATNAEAEAKDLQHEKTQNRSKVEGYDKIKAKLDHQLRASEEKWKPLLGYQHQEHEIECLAAPIGNQASIRLMAMMIFVKGELQHVTVTSEKVAITDDAQGHWILK